MSAHKSLTFNNFHEKGHYRCLENRVQRFKNPSCQFPSVLAPSGPNLHRTFNRRSSRPGGNPRRARRNHAPAFKAKVALAAIKGEKTLADLAQQFDIHSNQITQWKAQLLEGEGLKKLAGLAAAVIHQELGAPNAVLDALKREFDAFSHS